MCECMCIPCCALTLCCQDVSFFVSYLPRCPIFWQAELCACMCIMCVDVLTLCCQDVTSFVSYLPRCPIFWQAESHVCVHVYYNVCPCAYALTLLSRYFVSYLPSCPIFWQAELCVCVCACVLFVHVDDIYIVIVLKALASILIELVGEAFFIVF